MTERCWCGMWNLPPGEDWGVFQSGVVKEAKDLPNNGLRWDWHRRDRCDVQMIEVET